MIPTRIRYRKDKEFRYREAKEIEEKFKNINNRAKKELGINIPLNQFKLACLDIGIIEFEKYCEELLDQIINFKISVKEGKKIRYEFNKHWKDETKIVRWLLRCGLNFSEEHINMRNSELEKMIIE